MAISRDNSNIASPFFQSKDFQCVIFTGYEPSSISPMCALVDYFIDNIDLSYFAGYKKSNAIIGGRPALDDRIILKMHMYSLHCDIPIRQLQKHDSIGSEFKFLSHGIHHYPGRASFSRMLEILDGHIEDLFEKHLRSIDDIGIEIDPSALYCGGTVFEADNSRHKIITGKNLKRSNEKWSGVLDSAGSSAEQKALATQKLQQNGLRASKLAGLKRNSYGRADGGCVIMQDKNKSFIAGYNVQFVAECRHGIIVHSYISNKNPDSEAFSDIVDFAIEKHLPKNFAVDAGYGTPEIMEKFVSKGVVPITRARKVENSKSIINECSFELPENEKSLTCPTGRTLVETKHKDSDAAKRFKSESCDGCEIKYKCCPKTKNKSILINLNEFKALKIAASAMASVEGMEIYSHRANKCESPNGFIKYNLKGKKLTMVGLKRNKTIIHLYAILHNLRRVISIINYT
ncbi:MAG: transposase [Eubacteriaceae bacterium]|nr:transposase [Eubacteriaceae bacterium]